MTDAHAPGSAPAAVVLTGGTAARLGGADKASLKLAGTTLLDRALAATSEAAQLVVVGDPVATSRPVRWVRERPPGGGPAAALLAGLDALAGRPDLVLALAVDMPFVSPATVARLVAAAGGHDGAILLDGSGRRQYLAAAYRTAALRRTRPADRAAEPGLSMRTLVAGLRLAEVPAIGDEARDVDTWEDLRGSAE